MQVTHRMKVDDMTAKPPETKLVTRSKIACDGGEGALGHPRVWLQVPEGAHAIDCPYCGCRFELAEGAEAMAH
jgi:uncharacterized Zn-finger protein